MYQIYLCDTGGRALKDITRPNARVKVVLKTNGVGAWGVTTSVKHVDLIKPNRIIQIWRNGHYLSGGFIRKWEISGENVAMTGPDFNYLLTGRIVAYAAGSSEAQKNDYADDAIKEVIAENMGTSAATARQLNISIQGDVSAGATVSRSFCRRIVLKACQDLAQDSADQGIRVYFGFRPTWSGSLALNFETKTGQWGNDRSIDSESPVIFGEAYNNLAGYTEIYDYWDAVNDVYVGGQGLADDRLVVQVTDTAESTADKWALREAFLSRASELTSAALTSAGNELLYSKRPKKTFRGNLLETSRARYGIDWQWGDRVPIQQGGRNLDGIIEKVSISVTGNSESITAAVEGNL